MYIEDCGCKEELISFHAVLQNAWCEESCSPSLRVNWPNGNIAKGQCFVTALAVQNKFGGYVYELHLNEDEIHYYNMIEGKIVDLSSEQFMCPVESEFYSLGIKTDVNKKLEDPVKRTRCQALSEHISAINRMEY